MFKHTFKARKRTCDQSLMSTNLPTKLEGFDSPDVIRDIYIYACDF